MRNFEENSDKQLERGERLREDESTIQISIYLSEFREKEGLNYSLKFEFHFGGKTKINLYPFSSVLYIFMNLTRETLCTDHDKCLSMPLYRLSSFSH